MTNKTALATEHRIAAKVLRKLMISPNKDVARKAKRILEDNELFFKYVKERRKNLDKKSANNMVKTFSES